MIAKNIITDNITPLKTSDTGEFALRMMDDFKVSHLPIVNNIDFLGLISDSDIYSMNNFEQALGNHKLSLQRPFVTEYQHFYEVVKIVSELKLSLIPVLDNKNKYLGVISLQDLTQHFTKIASLQNPGGIIVLEINNQDYSLSQIAQIVESNDAKILSLYVSSHPDSTKMEVTLKINKIDIAAVLQTFNRYNYVVKETYSEKTNVEGLKERYDSFMRYLNV